MIYYRETLYGLGPKLTAVHPHIYLKLAFPTVANRQQKTP